MTRWSRTRLLPILLATAARALRPPQHCTRRAPPLRAAKKPPPKQSPQALKLALSTVVVACAAPVPRTLFAWHPALATLSLPLAAAAACWRSASSCTFSFRRRPRGVSCCRPRPWPSPRAAGPISSARTRGPAPSPSWRGSARCSPPSARCGATVRRGVLHSPRQRRRARRVEGLSSALDDAY